MRTASFLRVLALFPRCGGVLFFAELLPFFLRQVSLSRRVFALRRVFPGFRAPLFLCPLGHRVVGRLGALVAAAAGFVDLHSALRFPRRPLPGFTAFAGRLDASYNSLPFLWL